MNKLALATVAVGMLFGTNLAFAEVKRPAKPAAAPITYTINVGVAGKVVKVNVSGTAGVTVDVPDNGGKLIIAPANTHQQIGEGVTQLSKKIGADIDLTRHKIEVTLVAGATLMTKTAVLCNKQKGSPFYVDFAAVGQQALCTSQ